MESDGCRGDMRASVLGVKESRGSASLVLGRRDLCSTYVFFFCLDEGGRKDVSEAKPKQS